jgi:hypothetical protein
MGFKNYKIQLAFVILELDFISPRIHLAFFNNPQNMNDPLYPVQKDGKHGFINGKGRS